MQAVTAGRLGITLQAQRIQFLADQLRRLDDAVEFATLRVEVDKDEVRILERAYAAHPRILIDAAQVREIQQVRAIFRQRKASGSFLVVGIDGFDADPIGKPVVTVFLEKKSFRDAVGVPLERKRPVLQVRQKRLRRVGKECRSGWKGER